MAYSEVTGAEKKNDGFEITVRKKARYVDPSRCTACGACMEKCPTKVSNVFDMGLGKRKAIYMYYAQGIPACMTIDADHCVYHKRIRAGKEPACQNCQKVCEADAVNFEQKDEEETVEVGAVVVATGFSQFDAAKLPQYGYAKIKNVITGLEMERLMSAAGPTGGHLVRLSDHEPVNKIAFLQCVGSRDVRHSRFCSSVCCMHSTKQAIIANEHDKEVQSYIFYTDFRAVGKGFQEYQQRAINEASTTYIRARVAEISEDPDGSPVVWYEDTTSRTVKSMKADLAVLAMSLVPTPGARELGETLGIEVDDCGFFVTDPMEPVKATRPGIFACGYCQGPLDVPESVMQASGAAAAAAEYLAQKTEKASVK